MHAMARQILICCFAKRAPATNCGFRKEKIYFRLRVLPPSPLLTQAHPRSATEGHIKRRVLQIVLAIGVELHRVREVPLVQVYSRCGIHLRISRLVRGGFVNSAEDLFQGTASGDEVQSGTENGMRFVGDDASVAPVLVAFSRAVKNREDRLQLDRRDVKG